MKSKNFLLGLAIGILVGGFGTYLAISSAKIGQLSSTDSATDTPKVEVNMVSQADKNFLLSNTVGKTEAIEWIKIFKFRSKDLSNPRARLGQGGNHERRGGFPGDTTPTKYFSIPIEYIVKAFNFWNQEAGFPTRLNISDSSKGFVGFRIYPMIYPNDNQHPNKRRMNIFLVPIDKDGKELPDYKEFTGKEFTYIYKLPNFSNGTIMNEIGQCPPNCKPNGTLDSLSGF